MCLTNNPLLRAILLSFFLSLNGLAQAVEPVEIPADLQNRVDQLMDQVNTPDWQARQARYTAEIKALLKLPQTEGETEREDENTNTTTPMTQDRVVLFISESIPRPVLRTYARDMAKINGVMVLRGFKGSLDRLQPTVQLMGDILKIDENCQGPRCDLLNTEILIDPLLFREHSVDRVPALAFVEHLKLERNCRQDETDSGAAPAVIYGDARLSGLLKALHEQTREPQLLPLIRTLEGA